MATTYKVLGQVAGTTTDTTYNTISNKALTSNVATLTTGAVHGYAIGDVVTVGGVDTTFDGTYVVASIPTTTTFTYALTASNVTSAAVSPVGIVSENSSVSGVVITNKYKKNTVATLTANAHGLSVGDTVYISIGDTTIQGQYTVTGVPSAGLFTVTAAGSDIASTACGGAFGKLNSAIALTTLYTVPATTNTVISTLSIANRGTTNATYRIAIRPAGASIANTHYIAYDSTIAANDGILLTIGITLATTDVVSVSASAQSLTFNLFGSEIS
jgi:hypothetical protein